MDTELCDSLLKWLQTFDLESPHDKPEDVQDGVAMAQALHQIDPEWFSYNWLSKIKTTDTRNWRLKVSNLKKILERITDYYQDVCNQPLHESGKPDVTKIGEKCDPTELGRLLQLILGCAVNCSQKERYIERIMSLEESVQVVIMRSIQELESMHGSTNSYPFVTATLSETEAQVQKLLVDLQTAVEEKNQTVQRCLKLDMQVLQLQEEKASLEEDKKRLMERLQEDPLTGTSLSHRQIKDLKEQIFKLETSRDDYRMKVELQEKEMLELQSKLDTLQQTAGEARLLKDEVDILRETADKVEKYEATIQSYQKKLEELGDLKRECKVLESKNVELLEQNVELEKELKKSAAWKTQVEVYKKQIAELHSKYNEETKRADKCEFDYKKTNEQLKAVTREKESLMSERDLLKETNEELRCCQLQQRNDNAASVNQLQDNIISQAELKQKVVMLEHKLRLSQQTSEDEKLSVVQSLLDDAQQQINQLRLENRQLNQRIMELEGEVTDLHERGEDSVSTLKVKIKDLENKLQQEKEQRTAELEEREMALAEKKQIITLMQETISQKELEVQESEDKYKKCIEKAKNVVKAMDSKQVPSSMELNILRSQLLERQKMITDLEGQARQKESVDHRLQNLNLGQGQSFLARQRQPTSRRPQSNFNSK
ncbi:protein Hook homolog 3-like isoform X2 [Macrosteles quadrilineatus]|uniref:protein Hook homolog 3-like isoform X2 n=1 Tax=Macrosteles quadrilineatus TaxID=74068 RepID=UPI0023E27132|nr:protein Hook homolog 3-like isoform X2 [Macrosteles quadrilineatus]XP_054291014.1 protein Hook homolog 3-like isoform X2 [Macrosteles quadrilineatus]